MTKTTQPVTLAGGQLLGLTAAAPQDRRQFRARLVRAGRIKRADGSKANVIVPAAVIETAVKAGQFNNLAVFVDHPGFFENASLRSLVGVTHSAMFDDISQGAVATIRLYNSQEGSRLADQMGEVLSMMLDDAEQGIGPPDLGISLVFWPIWKPNDNREDPRVLQSFRKIDSADFVFSPAADGRILEALSTRTRSKGGISMEPEDIRAVAEDEALKANSPPAAAPAARSAAATARQVAEGAADVIRAHPAAWNQASQQAAVRGILNGSDLPPAARERLRRQYYNTPEELQQAIEDERQYLASFKAAEIIDLPDAPGISSLRMRTGMDQAAEAINWMFGVKDAPTPPINMRRLDQLYIALTGDYNWHGTFHPDRILLAGATTGTLANLAVNAMNKVVMAQLASLSHYRWYEMIAKPTPNDGSLQNMQWISFGGIAALPTVAEKGAYTELTVDDAKEADSFTKYGGYVGITREMIRNSEIQRIAAVPRALAAASVKTRSSLIAAIFTSNSGVGPTLDQDSTALFHSNHGSNVQTTAFGTDLTAWRAAAAECFKQTEINSSDRIGVFPKFCLVPVDLYFTALTVFGYGDGVPTTYTPEAQELPLGDPRPVPVAVPDWTDTGDWAYITDPNVWPVIHISFSADPSGRTFPPPEIFSVMSETGGLMFTNDVLPIKVRDEFAYGVNGWRGIGKRNVA